MHVPLFLNIEPHYSSKYLKLFNSSMELFCFIVFQTDMTASRCNMFSCRFFFFPKKVYYVFKVLQIAISHFYGSCVCWETDTSIGRCLNALLAMCVLRGMARGLICTCSQSLAMTQRAQLDPNRDPYVVNLIRSRLLILSCNKKLGTRFPIMTFLMP